MIYDLYANDLNEETKLRAEYGFTDDTLKCHILSFKELRYCARSLFCSMRVYLTLHFLPMLLKNYFVCLSMLSFFPVF